MLKDLLAHIGFQDSEISIFLTTASLGIAPASRIAKKLWLKRTTCYQMLENMCLRKIIKKHVRLKTRYYEAITISELLYLVKTQRDELDLAYQKLEENRVDLEKVYRKNIGTTSFSFFEWFADIERAYDAILGAEDTVIYSVVKRRFTINTHPLYHYWQRYLRERIKLGKTSYNLTNSDSDLPVSKKIDLKKLRETLSVPSDIFPIYGDLKISGDRIVIISQQEDRIFGVLLENKDLAMMFKRMIEIVWGQLDPDVL